VSGGDVDESLLHNHHNLVVHPVLGQPPKYYVIYGLAISATAALTEETIVNGYLLTRLDRLGWTPRSALVTSVALRTSYHVYYGLAVLLTIPVGYFLSRSFQKHGRLNRPIVAHFLYDAVLSTIQVLSA
jgi:membrane protease YdiL (CAAX protease family)